MVSQHFFAFSVDSDNFNKWVTAIKPSNINVLKQTENITDLSCKDNCHGTKTSLKTISGTPIDMVVKGRNDTIIPWVLFSNAYEASLKVLSWYDLP